MGICKGENLSEKQWSYATVTSHLGDTPTGRKKLQFLNLTLTLTLP